MAGPALYICDLDGTLLRSDATLSAFAREGLNELIDAGICLTVASARGTAGMRVLLDGVRLQLPVIELNGAFVSDLQSGRHVASNVLFAEDACAALDVILSTGVDPVVSGTAAATESTSEPAPTIRLAGTSRRSGSIAILG